MEIKELDHHLTQTFNLIPDSSITIIECLIKSNIEEGRIK